MSNDEITLSSEDINLSSDETMSDPKYDWTTSEDSVEVVKSADVDRQVTLEDPSNIVSINTKRILEQGGVRAVASIVDHPEYIDVDEASTSGRPLGVLDENPSSLVSDDNLCLLREIYGIPKNVELRAPKEYEKADWDIPGWTCYYEYTLRLGFRFPPPPLARRMLLYYDLAPGQLMPNTWRILLSLSVLSEKYNIPFGIESLLHNYYLKEHIHDRGRYMLIPRSKEQRIVIDTTTNDRNWKDVYFFAKGPQVDGPWFTRKGDKSYQCRRTWNRYGECHSTFVVS